MIVHVEGEHAIDLAAAIHRMLHSCGGKVKLLINGEPHTVQKPAQLQELQLPEVEVRANVAVENKTAA